MRFTIPLLLLCLSPVLPLFTSLKVTPFQLAHRSGVFLAKFHADHRLHIACKVKSTPTGQFSKHLALKLAIFKYDTYHQYYLDDSKTATDRINAADRHMDIDYHHDSPNFT